MNGRGARTNINTIINILYIYAFHHALKRRKKILRNEYVLEGSLFFFDNQILYTYAKINKQICLRKTFRNFSKKKEKIVISLLKKIIQIKSIR